MAICSMKACLWRQFCNREWPCARVSTHANATYASSVLRYYQILETSSRLLTCRFRIQSPSADDCTNTNTNTKYACDTGQTRNRYTAHKYKYKHKIYLRHSSNPQQAASAVGASNKSRSGALEARHCAYNCQRQKLQRRKECFIEEDVNQSAKASLT
jgi:hypothetical protein